MNYVNFVNKQPMCLRIICFILLSKRELRELDVLSDRANDFFRFIFAFGNKLNGWLEGLRFPCPVFA